MEEYSYRFVDRVETKLMILYIVFQAREIASFKSIPKQVLSDFIMQYINVDYFEMHQCILLLIEDGQLSCINENHRDVLSLTDRGQFVISQFLGSLPVSVTDKIDENIYKELLKDKEEKTVDVNYWNENEHCHTASLKIFDENMLSLHLALSFPDAEEAQIIARHFKKRPEFFYQKINEICSEVIDEENKENDK